MNGLVVGRLERESSDLLRFRYEPSWLARDAAIPLSLSMPLSPDSYAGDVVRNYLDNLLPDDRDIRERMRSTVGAESTRPFDLLAAAGKDCVGALQLFEGATAPDVRRVDADVLTEVEIGAVLRTIGAHPLGMLREHPDFRISLAGAQEKTALLWHRGRWHRPRGATPTTHIIKLPIGSRGNGLDLRDSVENEWLCLRIAAAFGLPVAHAQMQTFDDVSALVIERFDRRWSDDGSWLIRLHQEDFCQALGVSPSLKYEADGGPGIRACLDLLLQSVDPPLDRRNFFRALIVFWFLGAIDGHAKNFSLSLHPGGRCRATPIYDALSAWPIVARGQWDRRDLKLAMAVTGTNRHYRWAEVRRRHWSATAKAAGFSPKEGEQQLEECVALLPSVVERVSAALPTGFPDAVAGPIFDQLRALPKSLGADVADGV